MKLTFLKGKNAGDSREFRSPGIFIGREKDNDLQLLEEGVSQYHAKILCSDDKWILYDLNSSNGTKVNGNQIAQPTELHSQDVIHFANEAFRFEIDPEKDHAVVEKPEENVECIKIRGPEEIKSRMAQTRKFPEIEKKIGNKPGKTKQQIADEKQLQRLVNEAIKEKKKRLRTIILIITVLINAIILILWLRWQFA